MEDKNDNVDGYCPFHPKHGLLKFLYHTNEMVAWSNLVGREARSSEPAEVVDVTRRVIDEGWTVKRVKLIMVD